MNYKIILAITLIALTTNCGDNTSKTKVVENTKPALAFANAKDPTCGMDADTAWTDTAHYNNQVYGFCSPTCKKEFLANPTEGLKKMK